MNARSFAALLALCTSIPRASAQDAIAPGFVLAGSQPNPSPFAAYHTLSNGNRVVFDGTSIDLYDGSNQFLMNLGSLPGFVFSSFVEADPSETFVIVGESSNGELFKVFLDGSGMSALADLDFNYDAVFENATHFYVSAATCGFGCGNEIHRVSAQTGATTLVAQVPGSAGPLALAADGSLFYATISDMFPPPAGSTSVVSWTQSQLRSGTLLGLPDATLLQGGFDGAGGLAIDPVFGNVFLAESVFGATSSVFEIARDGSLVGAVVESSQFLTNLELRQGAGPGHFHAFQPEDGVFLHYSNGDIATVRPARPEGSVTTAGAISTFEVTGALPNSAMLVLVGPRASFDPLESEHALFPGFLFVTGFDLDDVRRHPVLVPIDANGTGSYSFAAWPASTGEQVVFQGLMMDASATSYIASSTAALF